MFYLEVVEHQGREGTGEHQRVLPVQPLQIGVGKTRHFSDGVGDLTCLRPPMHQQLQ
jgi:hypothetical protein